MLCKTPHLSVFFSVILAGFYPVCAAADDQQQDNTAQEMSLLDQIGLIFSFGDITKELNMEESGISGLNDTAGQSISEQQLKKLRKKYELQVQRNPQDAAGWASLGSILETLGEEEQAIAAYRQAVGLDMQNTDAKQGIERYQRYRQGVVKVYSSYQHQEEYAPSLNQDIATWEEQTTNIQVSKSWGKGKVFGIGWLESTIYQRNELYNDVDFSLSRKAPFLYAAWPVLDTISLAMRVRDEKFENDDDTGFYSLEGSEHIVTGYLSLAHQGNGYWLNLIYSREREPDPVYDALNNRSALNIEVKELTGISGGLAFSPSWELGTSLYYEQYGSSREDQFNPNVQISHWPSWLPGVRASLGYGYYSEEQENIMNFTTSYQWRPMDDLRLRFEYQLEYSENEDSLLNQGDILLTWSIASRLSLVLRADYSEESGGDEDSNFFTQASLNWAFY
jgi:tetratricopeptide (TPR) repeat protein